MQYLNASCMAAIDSKAFQHQKPFPWISVDGLLNQDRFRRLCETLPGLAIYETQSGRKNGCGDLYALQYRTRLTVAPEWHEFIAELHGEAYANFLRRLLGLSRREHFELTMHWHFAPSGFSLLPHVDAQRKLASHIFYFNTESDWDQLWGGQTVVLDDCQRLSIDDHPGFDDLKEIAAPEILGNRSFIFQRTPHSWHGVRPLACPEGKFRKVFIVVANRANLQVRWRHLRGKDADGYRLD